MNIYFNLSNHLIQLFVEATYAFDKKVAYIPCLMEKDFKPTHTLGILTTNKKYISFISDGDYDESILQLLAEVKHIEEELKETSNGK